MKKLRLTLDALTVESFAAEMQAEERGTVAGHDATEINTCDTCFNSCAGTCRWQTCNVPWACP